MNHLRHFLAIFVLLATALAARPAPSVYAAVRNQPDTITSDPLLQFSGVRHQSTSDIIVTNANDSGAGSLRQAIADIASGGTITFDSDYAITLSSQLEINKSLTIDGTGYRVVVSGNYASRVFFISAGTVTLSNLTIRDGIDEPSYGSASGAGLYLVNAGTAVTLNNCAVISNMPVVVEASVGGGIVVNEGTSMTINNSTISGNTATVDAGGILNLGALTLNSSTITNNTVDGGGGGLENAGEGTVALRNTIITGNTGNEIWGPDIYMANPAFTSLGYNRIGAVYGTFPATTGDMTRISLDLGPLQDNGGTTFTHALQPGSSAIDAIPAPGCNGAPSSDQRGVARPQGSACDIGAYEQHSPIRYAKPAGLTVGACDSWASACELSYALDYAISGQEVWAAAGMYTPTSSTDWGISFVLKNGIGVYGGFNGTETLREQRDWVLNETILSGDLNGDDVGFTNNEENSYHVVVADEVNNVILDGFTISGGNANMPLPNVWGGGMFIVGASPTVRNVIFINNTARNGGGGLTAFHSSLVLENVIFDSNHASPTEGGGGGMRSDHPGTPSLTNVIFKNNTANAGGGLMVNDQSDAALVSVTFSGNLADYGGGMYVSGFPGAPIHPILTNVTFSGNAAAYDGGGMWNEVNALVELTHVTFSGNSATVGGGIFSQTQNNYPLVKNSIFWGNTASGGIAPQIFNDDTTFSTVDTSIIEGGCPHNSTCSNIITADPWLGDLGIYGGFTETIPLLTGSSAIDAANGVSCPATDQRGITRPHDGDHDGNAICDIGAYEVTSLLSVSSIVRAGTDPTSASSVDFVVTFSEKVTGVDAGDFLLTVTNLPGAAITGVSGSGTTYAVSVNTGTVGSVNGSIRLDVVDNDSIRDLAGDRLGGSGTGNGNFTTGQSYTIAGHVSKPVSLAPPSRYITNNSQPTFGWGSVTDAAEYEILFANDSGFTQNEISYFVTDPSFTPETPLPDGKYYWQVRAYNALDEPGNWSTSRSFTIDTAGPQAPTLRSPANAATVRSVPTFRWNAVSDAVLYQFQLDNEEGFSSPLVSLEQRTTTRKPAGGLRGTYYWRVKAKDAAGNWSEWSPVFTVTITRSR